MKTRIFWGGFCLALLLLPGACSKSNDASKLPPMPVEGVDVDLPLLGAEFLKAAPELQQKVNEAVTKVRYRRYVPAMMDLDAAANSPGLTEKQKQLLTKVMSQLKEVTAKTPGNQ
jgi:hypothetical protein